MEWEGEGYPVKGMFGKIVWTFVAPFPVPLATKQHPVPISVNIPDKANDAIWPCRISS
jgi:hypothetical protein